MIQMTYIDELRGLNEEVRYILATYDADPEAAHFSEDMVMEKVIRQLAHTSLLANALLPLLDKDRERWYA